MGVQATGEGSFFSDRVWPHWARFEPPRRATSTLGGSGETKIPAGGRERIHISESGTCPGVWWNTQEFFESATPYEVRAYLEAWSRVNARNPGDTTPLHFAVSYNPDPAAIAVLLEAGADLNAREWLGRTPLHEAAWLNDNPAVITALVAVGADVNTRDDSGMTPLHTATQENFLSTVIEALLNAGADPSARGSEGRTPWALA